MIRKLAESELLSVADLCRRVFGPVAHNVAAILPPAFVDGQALGYFADGKLVGARIAFLEKDQFRTQIVAVDPNYQQDGIATELSLAGRYDAIGRGILRTVATIDLTNKASVSLAVNRLGLTADRFEKPNSLDASFLWKLDSRRALAADLGTPIPGNVKTAIAIRDEMGKAQKISMLQAAFDVGLLLIGLQIEESATLYLMGVAE